MEKLNFITVTDENRAEFHRLMQMYARELDENQNRNTNSEMLKKWTDKIIKKQHCPEICLKLCIVKSEIMGFLFGKIISSEDKVYKKVGCGYIMEFYVLSEYRRNGYGRQMYQFMESFFISKRIKQLYLTADSVTGKTFWEKMGFIRTEGISPENKQDIYEKTIL